MKKLISFVICIAFIMTMAINCFAFEAESFDNISEAIKRNAMTDCALIAQSQMDRYNNNKTIVGVSEVYNTADELIAYCYNFEPDGYVIVTIADYVPQVVAPAHETPYPHDVVMSGIKYAYGGGLDFWTISTDGVLTDIKTGMRNTVKKASNPFRIDENVSEKQTNLAAVLNLYNGKSSIAETGTVVTTSYNPRLWKNTFSCGPQATSIVLAYLHDYHGLTLPSDMYIWASLNNHHILTYLRDKNYLPDDAMSAKNLVHGKMFNPSFNGINAFFNDIGSLVSADDKGFSSSVIADIMKSIDNDYPAIVGSTADADFDDSSYTEHFLVAYGYIKYLTFSRFIVNDGRGNDGIELNALARNFDSTVLFS